MSARWEFFKGDTFSLSGPLAVTVNDTPLTDATGWTGAATVRRVSSGAVIATMVFSWVDAAAVVARVRSTGSTAAWPDGRACLRITLTSPGGVVTSTTTDDFEISV